MRRSWSVLSLLAILVVALGLISRHRSPGNPEGAPRNTNTLSVASFPQTPPVEGERAIVIHKAERALCLYLNGELAAALPIALGPTPEGHKTRQGDGRTPEGRYYICTRNPHSAFHLFLGISYPNTDDAKAALQGNRISEQQYRAILEATAARRQPPWNTPLGGEIGIHGGGTQSDWTLGCIALEDEAIEELWQTLRLGDPVIILP
ncbi:MAG: L,D-transpeptidase family protein [Armatimonadetes bacterium]|nr:L,D-transpeptidase family protein [Armatimonadota bacterium]NIM23025.1 L,D-transpeptidase family protein [Armatimonadota bacterium]NIM66893.1 L,D-transpeptidase family protein [Armatimonadota bacterium]NIM75427.1 L,D-transpeptidase family protein [Armatimonadota bacterium]NIN05084.1 L,D-transpeptidase family protein [Armatimonadota bacterium]